MSSSGTNTLFAMENISENKTLLVMSENCSGINI